jgi:hypothetical protein
MTFWYIIDGQLFVHDPYNKIHPVKHYVHDVEEVQYLQLA